MGLGPGSYSCPTLVSSLVHPTTLVTVGVYLIFRFDSIFVYFNINIIILLVGTLTILIARLRAFFEIDIKKIVALSTLRQLGVIITAIGAGFSLLGFFHLLSHAFFKALLFIRAGNIIHNSNSYQDLRTIGGASEIIPFTKRVVIGCSLRLCGLPFISAFYSKEIIIEGLLIYNLSIISYIFIILGILITVFYRVRFIIISVRWVSRQQSLFNKSDLNYTTNIRIIILFFPAIIGGGLIRRYMKFKFLFLVRSTLKISTLCLVILGIISYLCIFNVKLLNYKANLWRLRRLWALPFIRARLPVFINLGRGDFYHKLVDFSWGYFTVMNLLAGSKDKEVYWSFLFLNLRFIRIFRNIIIFILFFLIFI